MRYSLIAVAVTKLDGVARHVDRPPLVRPALLLRLLVSEVLAANLDEDVRRHGAIPVPALGLKRVVQQPVLLRLPPLHLRVHLIVGDALEGGVCLGSALLAPRGAFRNFSLLLLGLCWCLALRRRLLLGIRLLSLSLLLLALLVLLLLLGRFLLLGVRIRIRRVRLPLLPRAGLGVLGVDLLQRVSIHLHELGLQPLPKSLRSLLQLLALQEAVHERQQRWQRLLGTLLVGHPVLGEVRIVNGQQVRPLHRGNLRVATLLERLGALGLVVGDEEAVH
mmetsp:Transcript_38935/g.92148  ORF Transcript_38935/g.92148 Transcript_38935/m.92148 type:complete len:277 (+) Transcript_38935:161-991(+)